jgi:uncharacterized protein YdeI (YjbR/CyaY-like superfamily)
LREGTTKKPREGPIRLFKDQVGWTAWLEKNHRRHPGIWVRIAKKASLLESVSYPEALEIALCYGWIDGQKRPESDDTWLQRFLPRSSRSIWSKINREKAMALVESGRMKPAGLEAIEQAKASGHWERAYDSPSRARVPEDFQGALESSPKASLFFAEIDGANRYAILFRIQNAKKPETRARKIREFIQMLERRELIHQPRQKASRK